MTARLTQSIPGLSLITVVAAALLVASGCSSGGQGIAEESARQALSDPDADPAAFADRDLATDTSISSIDIDEILSGGPAKDGIPALTNPAFVPIEDSQIPSDDIIGILLEREGAVRYYPYNVLVWHEVVNDVVGGQPVAVTF